MKRLALILSFGLPVLANAADWTPVFGGQTQSPVLGAMLNNIVTLDAKYTPILNKHAKSGVFQNVPEPYRQDLNPAKLVIHKKEDFYEVIFPLTNATLYGFPIKEYVSYSGIENGFSGDRVVFGSLTTTQYAQLKKKKFKIIKDEVCGESYPEKELKLDEKTGNVYLVNGGSNCL